MDFGKQIKDEVYRLLQEPTLDTLRKYLCAHGGEQDSVDFKENWIDDARLAKEIISFANTCGGVIFVGIAEKKDHSYECVGLKEFTDKTIVNDRLRKYIPADLEYIVYDFDYDQSEYQALLGKKIQMIAVEDTPKNKPFYPVKEAPGLDKNTIYIRRGSSCQQANRADIERIIEQRIDSVAPNEVSAHSLREHMNQLEELYSLLQKDKVVYMSSGLSAFVESIKHITSGVEMERIPNPLYPSESYEEFVVRMIVEKKKVIQRILGIR